jgi:rare lipoprotein A
MRLAPFAVILTLACASTSTSTSTPTARARNTGLASYYADSLAGRSTASGEPYDPKKKTCAHRRLKFGTVVDVEVLATGLRATCRVNDRGPFVRGRIIDLSRAVAEDLDMIEAGVVKVRISPR